MTTTHELGEYAAQLARGAAELVGRLVATGPDLEVDAKSTATDLVTTVDRSSERWLVEHITADRPGDAVLGEESGERDGSTGVRWVLDPVDGTVNLVLGLPDYAVSVAAEVDGQVVAGAVCSPARGELFRATLGGGAWSAGRRLRGPRRVPLNRAVIGTGFGYASAMRQRQAAVVAELLPRIGDIRRIGAASLDLCAVACGRLDGYFEAGLHLWDFAAGALIAAEAGCTVTGLRGASASSRLTVATGTDLAADLRAVLEELGADQVSD